MMDESRFLTFAAIDSLMFRDGRPFNQADDGASQAVSVFPPYPPTLVGAVRAALWRQLGGKKQDWDEARLGNGTNWQEKDVLGPLSFGPPLLLHGEEPVFPIPLHIVEGTGKSGNKQFTRLAPGPELECDLGTGVRLPAAVDPLDAIANIEDHWVNLAGMQTIMNGGIAKKDDLVKIQDLWRVEPRVGIGISRETRTSDDGRLYMASHVRMADGVSLAITLTGWSDPVDDLVMQPLAGEHRMAQMQMIETRPEPPVRPEIAPGERYCIILISPMVPDSLPAAGGKLDDMPGTVVSACLGKVTPIGGWNSQEGKPIPLRPAVPAGSVWFMQLDENEAPDWESHANALGIGAAWGFGQYLIGKW